MVQLPESFLQSLTGIEGFDRGAFERVHQSDEQVTSIRINPAKMSMVNGEWSIGYLFQHLPSTIHDSPFTIHEKVPWSRLGFYLPRRPSFTFDPLFHAGCYYVQEASSMFLEQALLQSADLSQPLKVLDLCAAPGGKSTHLQSLITDDSLLVSNEVIKSRAGILKQNIIKWGGANVVVTHNDPQHFARMESFFDVMVIDAPCSGSGLFRRDAEAMEEWSDEAVHLCCGRQKRIIGDALPALKEDGILIYSTCSYSPQEDEDIADWLVAELGMENVRLKVKEGWGIVETESSKAGAAGYRFFPDKVKGEGFYLACFRRTGDTRLPKLKAARLEKASAKEKTIASAWLKQADMEILKHVYLYALPARFAEAYSIIRQYLNVQYAGLALGEVMKEKLVPEHALALSPLLSDAIPVTEVDYGTAIRYLQKQEVHIATEVKGWKAVSYQHHNLGWINALPNRVNNYYPKELRILKQRDDSAFEK